MSPQGARQGNLALVFQELLTVGERLRSNRQSVTDAASFRAQIWEAVKQADREARTCGYSQEDVEMAIFVVIAFLDESILNLRHPIFADWPRQPLQQERYGHQIAGEIVFQNLQKLLVRTDSQALGELLEIYYLCLLLGFAGRYGMGGSGELRGIMQQTADKLQRIRQISARISPAADLPPQTVRVAGGDPWVKRMLIAAIASLVLVIALFLVFRVTLGSGVESLRSLTVRG